MNKIILTATAVAAVALSSGCRHTTVVRTTHHPVEVIDSRTVVHEHKDVHVYEHRDAPRHTTRIIKEYRTVEPEPVYVPVPGRHDHDDRRRHVYEEERRLPPAHSNSRHIRGDEHPRPPVHSNSRYYRDDVPDRGSSRYSVSPRHDEPRHSREKTVRPAPVVKSHGDSARSRAVQEDRFDSRSSPRQQREIVERRETTYIRNNDNRREPVREVRPQPHQQPVESTRRSQHSSPQIVRSASPKAEPRRHEQVKQSRESRQEVRHNNDKQDRGEKRSHGARDDDEEKDKRGNDRSAKNYRN